MLKKFQRMSSLEWMDRKPAINEALELALEAIDKETKINPTTTKMTTTTNKLPNDDCMKTITTTTTATSKVIKNSKLNNKRNKTDEEKELNSRKQFKNDMNININNNDNEDNNKHNENTIKEKEEQESEVIISKEPIYENVATEMLSSKDDNTNNIVAAKIIPNSQTNSNNNNPSLNELTNAFANNNVTTILANSNNMKATKTEGIPLIAVKNEKTTLEIKLDQQQQHMKNQLDIVEPYYQVPKSCEPYYDAPKHLRPIPVYENIDIFYNGLENSTLAITSFNGSANHMEPPKEKPPPPPIETPPPPMEDDVASIDNTDTWSSDNTYETISSRLPANSLSAIDHPSPPIKRMNSTKRIKKELRNKRSSFLGIEGSLDDEDTYLELTVGPPPDMAQLLQEERRLEKQLYMKAGLCDSSDTGESRDSGVSENHSRQSSEHYTNSSEENEHHTENTPHNSKLNDIIYQNDGTLLTAAQTPLLQTVKGNSTESWTESATAAAAATQSLSEATATANAKMLSIEEKIREQEEVLRVERELLQLEQEELKRQRENLMLRENIARRELQHGAKMLMSANRHSLQDLNGIGMSVPNSVIYQPTALTHPMPQHQPVPGQKMRFGPGINSALQTTQQIYANVPDLQQQYYQVGTDYRKSMTDLNEFSKRMMLPPTPPTKPMRSMHITTNGSDDFTARQRHSLNTQNFGGSLVKIAAPAPTPAPRDAGHIYSNYHHQSSQNIANPSNIANSNIIHHGNMTRNTLHALSATPKPKYTDGWVQVQNRKTYDNKLSNDPAWVSAYQQKRKSMPDAYGNSNNHWLVQEAEQRRLTEQQQQQQHRRSASSSGTISTSQQNGAVKPTHHTNGKPLPDAIIQTLTERVQSKGIGERKRFDNYSNATNNNIDKSALYATSYQRHAIEINPKLPAKSSVTTAQSPLTNSSQGQGQEKVLSVSGKKKCSHCGDELGRGAAMIIESLLLFYHINCFKCCVCHVQLGDGLNGTDVRVRNHKLHCQNCYSSDDGIKFSCV